MTLRIVSFVLVACYVHLTAFGQTIESTSESPDAAVSVTTTSDTIDAAAGCAAVTIASLPGPDGVTSLREAICATNNNAGADAITFSVSGTFILTGAANDDTGISGDLDVKGSVAITGNGAANTIIDGNGIERIFDVFPSAAVTFDLSGLTLQHGDTRLSSFKEGGAMYLHNNVTSTITNCSVVNNFSGANGAIENRGTLSVSGSLITGNQTLPASGSVVGGGMHNSGPLTINNSTFSNNTVRGEGGGLATTTSAAVAVNITNSTFSGNIASVAGGGLGNGGALSTTGNQGTINITNATFSANSADNNGGAIVAVTPAGGTGAMNLNAVTIANNAADLNNDGAGAAGGIFQSTAAVTVRNSIVARNFNSVNTIPDDVSGSFGSSSFDLIGNGAGSSFVNGTNSNQVGTAAAPIDPLIGSLANNGGPTLTHRLFAGGPAVNTADPASAPLTDQRGVVRSLGGPIPDRGAYELTPSAAGVSISGSVTSSDGRGITNARVTISGGPMADQITIVTGRNGRFIFEDVQPGQSYLITVNARRFGFSPSSVIVTPNDNISDVNFVANGRSISDREP